MALNLLPIAALCQVLISARPAVAPDCQQRVNHAYEQLGHWQKLAPGRILELRFTAETSSVPPGKRKLERSSTHCTLLAKQNQLYYTTGENEIYQDGRVQVSIARTQRTILITPTPANNSSALVPWIKMQEQVQHQTFITECGLQSGMSNAPRRIVARPLEGSTLAGKVTSIAYLLDKQTDALQKMTMYYPAGHNIQSAALVIDSQRYKTQDAAVEGSALSHVYGPGQQLLAQYRNFEVHDQR